jgi:putative tryptophan/tyrosine transport system substrate-binding protein
MRRREFIAFVGGAAIALPRGVFAQQPIPVIVFFNSGAPSTNAKNVAAFRNGLKEAGLVEGQNLAIEFVWAENRFDGLETLAAEVIARGPSVISATLWRRSEPSHRPQQYRSCSPPAAIRSGTDWYQA